MFSYRLANPFLNTFLCPVAVSCGVCCCCCRLFCVFALDVMYFVIFLSVEDAIWIDTHTHIHSQHRSPQLNLSCLSVHPGAGRLINKSKQRRLKAPVWIWPWISAFVFSYALSVRSHHFDIKDSVQISLYNPSAARGYCCSFHTCLQVRVHINNPFGFHTGAQGHVSIHMNTAVYCWAAFALPKQTYIWGWENAFRLILPFVMRGKNSHNKLAQVNQMKQQTVDLCFWDRLLMFTF